MEKRSGFVVVVVLAFVLAACGSLRQQAFKDAEGNSITLGNSEAEVRKSVLMTLAAKGFQAEAKDGVNVIKGKKIIGDGGKSCAISMDCFLFPMADNSTRLQVAATEEISKTSSHVKYFWLLFIPIPYGSYNTTAVVETNTIDDKEFYASFFKKVQGNLPTAVPAPVATGK
ncbi:MAG: hypothetical protein HZB63_02125 [Deltaproteobacteria bacterium]|nr:hypothetical protein [Deltaproteobacteria bacterium]